MRLRLAPACLALPLIAASLAGCDGPPDGIKIDADTARVAGTALVYYGPPDYSDAEVEPPAPHVVQWLLDRRFEYRVFEADSSAVEWVDSGAVARVPGTLVYTR